MTSMEREEKEKVKKREKKLEDEETLQQATWVKYTFPIKHQVCDVSFKLSDSHTVTVFVLCPSLIYSPATSVVLKGVETERRGVPRDRLRRLELDQ